jgi:outer membrane protein insertion porin family
VSFRGNRAVPERLLRDAVMTRPGEPLDVTRIADDVRRLLALEALENVSVESDDTPRGANLSFVVQERRLVGRVDYLGLDRVPVGRHLPLAAGELYDPARVFRAGDRLKEHLIESGYARAEITTLQRVSSDASVSVCFRVRRGPRFVLEALDFPGAESVDARELRALIHTEDGKVNMPGTPYRPDLLEANLVWLSALYYDRGFVEVKVGPPRASYDDGRGRVRVEVPIVEGSLFRVGSLSFRGELAGTTAEHRSLLGVESDSVFNRTLLAKGLERLREHYRKMGRNVDVVPETALDHEHRRLNITLRIEELE